MAKTPLHSIVNFSKSNATTINQSTHFFDMKNIFPFIFAMIAGFASAQSDSIIRNNVSAFKNLEVSGSANVQIIPSDRFGYSANYGKAEGVTVSNDGQTLSVNGSSGTIFVFTQGLQSISSRGSAKIVSNDTLIGNHLSISAIGSGKIQLILNYNKVHADLAGSPNIYLQGKTLNFTGDIAGSGEVQSYQMKSDTVNFSISGSGEAKVNAQKVLKGSIAGSGKIYYVGDPSENNVNITGSGSVSKSNGLALSDTTMLFRIFNKDLLVLEEENKLTLDLAEKNENQNKTNWSNNYTSIWNGVELGINGYVDNKQSLAINDFSDFTLRYNRSLSVNINALERHLKIVKNNLYLVTGVGVEFNNYFFEKNIRFRENAIPLDYTVEDTISYSKNKLALKVLNVPLYLSIRTNGLGRSKKQIILSPGVVGGWVFDSHQKRVIDTGNGDNTSKTRNSFNTNPFRLNASLRVSVGNFVAFANYSLNSMFQKDRGPELYPFSMGVRLVGF